jgi:hypothetical protein
MHCLFLLICRTKPETVSLSELREEHLYIVYSINVFKSLISNVQPGFINNFVKDNTAIKASFHAWYSLLCCFIHTPCIVLNSNATFAFPTPISPNCYLSKSGRHVTSLARVFPPPRRVGERAWVLGWRNNSLHAIIMFYTTM